MAKADGPGFLDKHIEKVILPICLLVFLYVLLQYGVSSQRTYEIAGEQNVPPSRIDSLLLEQARQLEKRISNQEAPQIEPRKDLALLKTLQNDPLPAPQPEESQTYGVRGVEKISLSFGNPSRMKPTEIVEGPEQAPPLAKLIEVMPAPAKPLSWAGPEIILREGKAQNDELELKIEELPTWRAASWYPWEELNRAWQRLLRRTVIEPKLLAMGYEAEIQIRRPDGSWETTDDVKPVFLPLFDSQTREVVEPPPRPEYTGANGEMVHEWLEVFEREWMVWFLQPEYHEIWMRRVQNPTWRAHFPFDILLIYPQREAAEAAAGRSGTAGKTGSTASLLNRYRTSAAARRAAAPAVAPVATARNTAAARMPAAMPPNIPPGAFPPPEMVPPAGPYGGYPGPVPSARTTGRTASVRRAAPVAPLRPTPAAALEKEEEEIQEELPEIPDFDAQLATGKILLWFHANNIQMGREYRCRFRLIFANPLLTHDKDLDEANRKDAYVPSVKTKWSEWSDPIQVRREVDFFVTGAFPHGNRVTVTVFTKWMDQRLMHAISKVAAGERIRGSRKVKVLNPATGEAMKDENGQDPVVEFDTGAIAIQMDFNRRIQTTAGPRDDVELVYLDAGGRLRVRSMYRDRNSDRYKKLESEARKAAAPFEPERPKPAEKPRPQRPALAPPEFEVPNLVPSGRGGTGQAGQPGDEPFPTGTRTRTRSTSTRERQPRERTRSR